MLFWIIKMLCKTKWLFNSITAKKNNNLVKILRCLDKKEQVFL